MSMKRRTDPHRKGAIIPAEYEHVLSYNCPTTQDGWPVPAFGINCEIDLRQWFDKDGNRAAPYKKGAVNCVNGEHRVDGQCCVIGLMHVANVPFANHGSVGKCSACGTRFVYGEVWKHKPTGEHVHIGHICSANYGLVHDRSVFELEAERRAKATAAQCIREKNAEERRVFLDAHPGLEDDLETDHYIVQDIKARFKQYRQLSDKQIALVHKLANEKRNPQPEESYVNVPTGRQTFQGRVVSVKDYESVYGTTLKMTVKMETADGVWLAWGTVPRSLLGKGGILGALVEITATLQSGRDKHFAIAKRPTARIIEVAA